MPESIQEFVYSSFGIAVEYDTILAKIRDLVSNKVAMADGPTPMDVDKVSEFCEDDPEIDVVNMSMQCHGCGGWEHHKSQCPTAWAGMQEQHQVGSNGSKGPERRRQELGQGNR